MGLRAHADSSPTSSTSDKPKDDAKKDEKPEDEEESKGTSALSALARLAYTAYRASLCCSAQVKKNPMRAHLNKRSHAPPSHSIARVSATLARARHGSVRLLWSGPKPVGNGGQTEKYRWTQTLQELSVYFLVPANLKGKDIIVDFQQKRLKVRTRPQPNEPTACASVGPTRRNRNERSARCGNSCVALGVGEGRGWWCAGRDQRAAAHRRRRAAPEDQGRCLSA
jgi:hypothetical protein